MELKAELSVLSGDWKHPLSPWNSKEQFGKILIIPRYF